MRLLLPALIMSVATPVAAQPDAPLTYARLGQVVRVDGPRLVVLAVREDSRCPRGVYCRSAGHVRVSVRLLTGRDAGTMELTMGQPLHVADGMLELASVTPDRCRNVRIAPGSYRFGFRFAGGF